ncbi:MAG: cobalt-precorrin-5B (C(1))-methyltransferase [Mangrovicoccus sp.]|nr:cobalt-precorrin-5B (C(1))-methyltransferase [Mangrovicoccus sp.]
MDDANPEKLRRGWTTGACATAAVKGALLRLWSGQWPGQVGLELPRGEQPVFDLVACRYGEGWAECAVIKDAGDDPDITHGAQITARVRPGGQGIRFAAGPGVGRVTKAGLPLAVGEAAINPVPRQMMAQVVAQLASQYEQPQNLEITISVPGGEALADKTWNPRLGIVGGLSILGTTGVVRPFSCAAWIASIHRGVDVARADGLSHVAGCTGATSEKTVQGLYGLPDHAMLDMGDFAGGLLKYLVSHPVERVTIAGGIGKMTKLAQGARDLHSKRSQVDFARLAKLAQARGLKPLPEANTALEALRHAGPELAQAVAEEALDVVQKLLRGAPVVPDLIVIDRAGVILGRAGS